MENQTPPIAALENLTITTKIKLTPTPSREESYRRAYLNTLLAQWYKPSSQVTRMKQPGSRAASAKRARTTKKIGNVVEYNVVGERITRLLRNMAEEKLECRDRLELAISYVQRRENQEQVLSIVKSLY